MPQHLGNTSLVKKDPEQDGWVKPAEVSMSEGLAVGPILRLLDGLNRNVKDSRKTIKIRLSKERKGRKRDMSHQFF